MKWLRWHVLKVVLNVATLVALVPLFIAMLASDAMGDSPPPREPTAPKDAL
jgi:hypothetical protein